MSRVDVTTARAQLGKVYPLGCSGFVCELLGRPQKQASKFTKGASIGANGKYHNVSPGDIVGFPGHVAVFVGGPRQFIDVNGAGGTVRELSSYGATEVFHYSY